MLSKRGSAAVPLLPRFSEHMCMFASVPYVHVCFRCVVLCWQPAGMSGVARAALQLNVMRALASVRLLFLLSAAFCYDPWPRLAKSVSQSSQTIVVGLCIWVTKQPLACSHAELCHAELLRDSRSRTQNTYVVHWITRLWRHRWGF